jgi:YHS domain-containing protein
MHTRRGTLGLLAMVGAGALTISWPRGARAAKDPVYTSLFGNVALSGYDPVAYFTDGRPVEGRPEFELAWNGATWRFASAEHRDLFKAAPERYAPRYGGYCAYAVSQGYTASADPQAWKIVDGHLYLNYNREVQRTWEQDTPGYIAKADHNWPGVLAR